MTTQLKDPREVRVLAAAARAEVPLLEPREVGEKPAWDDPLHERGTASVVRGDDGALSVHCPGCRTQWTPVVDTSGQTILNGGLVDPTPLYLSQRGAPLLRIPLLPSLGAERSTADVGTLVIPWSNVQSLQRVRTSLDPVARFGLLVAGTLALSTGALVIRTGASAPRPERGGNDALGGAILGAGAALDAVMLWQLLMPPQRTQVFP